MSKITRYFPVASCVLAIGALPLALSAGTVGNPLQAALSLTGMAAGGWGGVFDAPVLGSRGWLGWSSTPQSWGLADSTPATRPRHIGVGFSCDF